LSSTVGDGRPHRVPRRRVRVRVGDDHRHEIAAPAADGDKHQALNFARMMAGAPELGFSDAWECVENYLERISSVQASGIGGAHAGVERALPDWRRRLGLRIAAHDLALAAHRALGDQQDRIEQTRLAVADVLDGARAADASEDELDAFIQWLGVEQCDLFGVIAAAVDRH
jgi:hypothetical protein